MSIKLVVGLGNPGNRYSSTRHNIGFDIVDALVEHASKKIHPQLAVTTSWHTKDEAEQAQLNLAGEKVFLMKPLTFMNNSGAPVSRFAQFYKMQPEEIIVVSDDLDLPLGTIRLKQGGGEAGHNGLRSISERLGTKEYLRLRVGIGRPNFEGRPVENEGAVTSWVLEKFKPEERAVINNTIALAIEGLIEVGLNGLIMAQNKYNS